MDVSSQRPPMTAGLTWSIPYEERPLRRSQRLWPEKTDLILCTEPPKKGSTKCE
jgi:hypothetical protein